MKRETISMEGLDSKTSVGLSDLEAAISVGTENGEVMAGEQKPWQDFRKGATQALTVTVASLRLLWERRRFLAGITVAGLLLSTLIAFLIPNRYESTVHLMPPDNPPGLTQAALALAGGTAGLGTIASQLLAQKNTSDLLAGILSSRIVGDTLIQKFDLRKVYKTPRIEDTREELARHTAISVDRSRTQIITFTVVDKSPQRAVAMAQAYVEELNRTVAEVSTSSARRERIFLEGRLQAVKQDLEAAEKEFSQFLSNNTAIDIKEPGKAMLGAPAILQGQYLAARSELEGLRRHYGDSDVRVRSLQARVAELENQLAQAGGQDDSASGKATQGDALYPWIRNLPLLGVTYADLYRRTKTQEMLFDTLTQEYELARVQEAKGIPSVKVLDPPSVPEKKSYPPRLLFIILGIVLALACGVAWVFGRRSWEQIDPSNPGKVLALEVFSTVRGAMPWTSRKGS